MAAVLSTTATTTTTTVLRPLYTTTYVSWHSKLRIGGTGFASWLRYCTDVAQQRSATLCTTFSRLLSWYNMYTFSGALVPERHSARCINHFGSKSCIILYWQHYCMALEQWASAKLCSVVSSRDRVAIPFDMGSRTVKFNVCFPTEPDF